MQTRLAPEFQAAPEALTAEAILRSCVHCGFCTATCPTYQLLGDELDGPRGRIYLMKQVLEGAPPSRSTQLHLDRCLSCRGCETTCPSGVQYGQLVEIGRQMVDQKVRRPWAERMWRWLLKEGLSSRAFAPALRLGQLMRPLLPAGLRARIPPRAEVRGSPARAGTLHSRELLLLDGCVQPALRPQINRAAVRVLDAAGFQTRIAPDAGCCGALRSHMGDAEGGRAHMRRNIDAWWPWIESGRVEALVITASGCASTVKDYGHALAGDPGYADRAKRVSELARDLSELLPELLPRLASQLSPAPADRLAYHPPCSLQHGQKLRGPVEQALRSLGFELALAPTESHLCCGSAGTYSLLQPALANTLRDRKLAALSQVQPQCIVSANIGCIQHLQGGTDVPVIHWIELLDGLLATAGPG